MNILFNTNYVESPDIENRINLLKDLYKILKGIYP